MVQMFIPFHWRLVPYNTVHLSYRVARRMTGMTVWRTRSGEWEWPPVAEALETAGLCLIKEYIQWRQDTVVAQVA